MPVRLGNRTYQVGGDRVGYFFLIDPYGSVRKPNLPGDESVSLFLGFTISKCAEPEVVRKNPLYLLLWDRFYYPSVFSNKFG